jgi:RNA methyltransferase, TrmH family
MTVSKNKVKQLASLSIKKYRLENRLFVLEGDKIVRDALQNKNAAIKELVAEKGWIEENRGLLESFKGEIAEAESADLSRISSLESPPPVIAIHKMFAEQPYGKEIEASVSIGLNNIQDPGNLGTIIRTADWFGVGNIFCTPDCVELYNPKVIQASMGAIFNVRVHYVDLERTLKAFSRIPDFTIAGTYMEGTSLWKTPPLKRGIVVFGNESRGISANYNTCITHRITIPPNGTNHVESLNVASSLAIVLAHQQRGTSQ